MAALGTPGCPLFTSMRINSLSYYCDRKSMPRYKGLPFVAPSLGATHTFCADLPALDVSVSWKVLPILYNLIYNIKPVDELSWVDCGASDMQLG